MRAEVGREGMKGAQRREIGKKILDRIYGKKEEDKNEGERSN